MTGLDWLLKIPKKFRENYGANLLLLDFLVSRYFIGIAVKSHHFTTHRTSKTT